MFLAGDTGVAKTMRFTGNMSISEAIKEIREKLETGGQDHGLFQPINPKVGRASRWLRGDRTFNFYDVKSGEEIIYRKKHRPLKVLLMDDSVITVIIDDSATVTEHCVLIAEKMDLPNPEEYSLLLPGNPRWLNAAETLCAQSVDDGSMVVFKKKYFVTDMNVDKTDVKERILCLFFLLFADCFFLFTGLWAGFSHRLFFFVC